MRSLMRFGIMLFIMYNITVPIGKALGFETGTLSTFLFTLAMSLLLWIPINVIMAYCFYIKGMEKVMGDQ